MTTQKTKHGKGKDKYLELEKLAREFIIGYKPLTEYQKELLEIVAKLQNELNKLRIREKRIERLIDVINKKVAEDL